MPKHLFYSLNQNKRNKIIESAYKEFSSISYEKASINKIIKEAEISRGSYYLYFEDKEDLYLYLVLLINKRIKEKIVSLLKENKDIFDITLNLYEFIYKRIYTDHKDFMKNLIRNFNPKINSKIKSYIKEENDSIAIKNILVSSSIKQGFIDNEEDLINLVDILHSILIDNIIKSITEDSDNYEKLIKQVSLLKKKTRKDNYA